jgi:hypothetical protein
MKTMRVPKNKLKAQDILDRASLEKVIQKMMQDKVFILGPMTGYKDFNYPAFHAAEKELMDEYNVSNPAKNFGGNQTLPWNLYLRTSIRQLCDCDYVYKLPGWWKSKGALLESLIAWCLKIGRVY